MPEPSPGQVCYEAFVLGLGVRVPRAWETYDLPMQRAWEAAAQAVLAWKEERHNADSCA